MSAKGRYFMHNEFITRAAADGGVHSGSAARTWGLVLAVPCWAVLLTAWSLTPRRAGYGTAEQLGLPACSLMAEKGIPCPTCGMTTSVSAAAHGDFVAAVRAHPFGPVFFACVVAGAAIGTGQVNTGRNWISCLGFRPWWLVAALVGLLAGWGAKLAIGYASGEYPTH